MCLDQARDQEQKSVEKPMKRKADGLSSRNRSNNWTPECFYTSGYPPPTFAKFVDNLPLLDAFNDRSLSDVAVGESYMFCQGKTQIEREKRHEQMEKQTRLEWCWMSKDKKVVKTNRRFKIVAIRPGVVGGIPFYFNGHILVLERVVSI